MAVEFWYNNRAIGWSDLITKDITDGQTVMQIEVKNNTPRHVRDITVDTELPVDVQTPDMIPPDATDTITITAKEDDLLAFRPTSRPSLHWHWKEVIE